MTIASHTASGRSNAIKQHVIDADEEVSGSHVQDRSIGDIFRQSKNLTDEQIKSIVDYQAAHGGRFGEAAVKLGLASDSDVVFALSQQFDYPYMPESRREMRRELIAASQPFSKQSEAFRAIRSQLMMRVFNPSEPKRAVAVLSTDQGDGKTFFAANLAVVLAQLGGRTLVVDADMRNPRLHELFDLPNTSGLSSILSGRQDDNVIYQAPDIPSLFVMPVGVIPPNPLELLERPAFRLLMGELLRKFDHVIVDTPAASLGSDALVISACCHAALTIARKDQTKLDELKDLTEAIAASTAKLVGVIFNEH